MPSLSPILTDAIDRRTLPAELALLRATEADGVRRLGGYASVFYRAGDSGTEFALWDDLVERIMPGAFDRALRERHDARGLFNHNPNVLLGRVGNGTVRLEVDAVGLRYEIDLPDAQFARDLWELAKRGDIPGSSFAFIPRAVRWVREEKRDIREIQDLDLFDVSPVAYPAYTGTSAWARAEDEGALRSLRERLLEERSRHSPPAATGPGLARPTVGLEAIVSGPVSPPAAAAGGIVPAPGRLPIRAAPETVIPLSEIGRLRGVDASAELRRRVARAAEAGLDLRSVE